MKLFPYLKLYGNARQALNTYKDIFKGTIQRLNQYKNSPLASESNQHFIIHGELHFGGNIICMADYLSKEGISETPTIPNDQAYELCLNFDSSELTNAERIFKQLSQKGEILMKFQKTFWGAYYGKIKDQFGVIWSLNCSIEPPKSSPKKQGHSQKKQSSQKQQSEKSQDSGEK